jgi:cysteine desulfurase
MARIYFDHNAGAPLSAAARAAMRGILDGEPGNPSSIHAEGRRARQALEAARDEVAGAARPTTWRCGCWRRVGDRW